MKLSPLLSPSCHHDFGDTKLFVFTTRICDLSPFLPGYIKNKKRYVYKKSGETTLFILYFKSLPVPFTVGTLMVTVYKISISEEVQEGLRTSL